MAIASTWHHPRLGQFTRRSKLGLTWVTTINAPAFDAFSYTTKYSNDHPPDGRYELYLGAGEQRAPPADAAANLALRVLVQQEAIVGMTVNALWEYLNGRGPKLRARWWYGGLCRDDLGTPFGTPAPTRPAELLPHLRLGQICVDNDVDGYDDFLARLCFRVSFDEHGLDVLTDAERVVGLGPVGEGEVFVTA